MYSTGKSINTAIPGMREYSQEFEKKYEEEIKVATKFAWIFKG